MSGLFGIRLGYYLDYSSAYHVNIQIGSYHIHPKVETRGSYIKILVSSFRNFLIQFCNGLTF